MEDGPAKIAACAIRVAVDARHDISLTAVPERGVGPYPAFMETTGKNFAVGGTFAPIRYADPAEP